MLPASLPPTVGIGVIPCSQEVLFGYSVAEFYINLDPPLCLVGRSGKGLLFVKIIHVMGDQNNRIPYSSILSDYSLIS